MPYASLTQKDQTASKIPAPGPCGTGAFCPSGGYSTVVCCPIMIIVYPPYLAIKAIIEKRREKKEAAAKRHQGKRTETDAGTSVERDQHRRQKLEHESSGGIEMETNTTNKVEVDTRSESHPGREVTNDNPRICSRECPGYHQPKCPVHDREEPKQDQSVSPGLLAV